MTDTATIYPFLDQRAIACRALRLEGRNLHVLAESAVHLRQLIKVESANQLWMGEVWACKRHEEGFQIEMQVHSTLGDVAAVAELATRFKHNQ